MPGDDPASITAIAVTRSDVVTTLESNVRTDDHAVLRVTPPFSGRMRARIHEAGAGEFVGEGEPIHVDPSDLVDGVPPYPEPSTTEDALRADHDEAYTPERHRQRHVEAVEEWRGAVRSSIVDGVTLETDGGRQTVAVKVLG